MVRPLIHYLSSHPLTPKPGDIPLLTAARAEARNNFRKNASLRPEDPAVAPAIAHAEEVARILKENIVQGKHEGDDMYSEFSPLFRFLLLSWGVMGVGEMKA
jgi:hypothetical protein